PKGGVAYSADQAVYRATEIGGSRWVVKAQIHSGARGKAGGIKLCASDVDVRRAAKELLGTTLVTMQTGPDGLPVHRVLVEEALPIARELYVGLVLDRKRERIVVVAHPHGGMEIEEIAQREPEAILREVVEPAVGMQAFQARELAFGLGLAPPQVSQAVAILLGAYRAFRELDATMVEVNPLVVTADGQVLALDVKMSFDDNAMFRRPNVVELRDYAQEDPREAEAAEHGLNYVPLVVRLAGTNVEEGRRILKESGLPIITAGTLAEAADRVVGARRSSPPDPLSVPERGNVQSPPSPAGRGGQGVRTSNANAPGPV